ncbi:MAG: S66 peptidase family protein [Bacillota bacterium]
MKKIKSKRLEPGATIAVIAPASPVHTQSDINQAVSLLTNRGYQVFTGQTAVPLEGDLAGNDLLRQSDLESCWQDRSVQAIWCLRGGYGCLRLLPRLWFNLFARKPKILIGFSDITALELAIWSQVNLVTFHGPVLNGLESDFSIIQAFRMLNAGMDDPYLPWPLGKIPDFFYTIKPGKVRGILIGGNLATIASLIGTRFLPDCEGAILFIEEVHEPVYRIDRMLTQLILSGILDNVAAVIVGRSVPSERQSENDLIVAFAERLGILKCPSAYGFPIGHQLEQWTIPQGVWAEVDTTNGRLALLESPFETG